MTQAIIFDCFGVLISDALSAMCETLARDDPTAIGRIWELIGQSNRGIMTSDDASTKVAAEFGLTLEEYRAQIAKGELKNQQLLDYILRLRKDYRIALLSNIASGASIHRRFSDEELKRYFDEVVLSGEIGVAKPDPDAYTITAERLGVKPEACIFVDDRIGYLEGAESVGMRTILYEEFDQFKRDLLSLLADA